MSNPDLPPFDEAQGQFRSFLAREGFRTEIQWLFREDAIDLWPRTFVRVPLQDGTRLVEQLYAEGMKIGLGVNLNTFCLLDDRPCCYIWLPKDEVDASYRMLNGLKLSVQPRTDIRAAVPIKNRLYWKWLKWRERRSQKANWAKDIPSRLESFGVGTKVQ